MVLEVTGQRLGRHPIFGRMPRRTWDESTRWPNRGRRAPPGPYAHRAQDPVPAGTPDGGG